MKPCLLIIISRLVLGGQATDTLPLADYLKEEYDIKILYGEKEKDEREISELIQHYKGISFLKISSLKRSINPFNDIVAAFSIYKIIKSFRPVIVHTHGSKPGFDGRLAAWSAKVPVIIHTFHGHLFHSYYNSLVSRSIIKFERFLSRLSTKIIVLSKQQQKEICQKYKIASAKKVEVIPLGVDEKLYNNNAEILRANFRNNYQLVDECVAVGIIGRIVPVKNHRMFINVIKRLLQINMQEKVKFFFIGDGYAKNELQNCLTKEDIKWSEDKNVPDAKVIFTSWVMPVTDALHGLDIVALTSLNEGTPISLIEAQICSKPVVSTDVGGVTDTFINNESGFLIKNRDEHEFANKLLLLVQNKELRRSMGERGNLFAKEKFSKQTEVNAFRKLYADCIASSMK